MFAAAPFRELIVARAKVFYLSVRRECQMERVERLEPGFNQSCRFRLDFIVEADSLTREL